MLNGAKPKISNKEYDWLGEGFYAWESDPERAYEWANRRYGSNACVIGLVVNLGNCLDLTNRSDLQIIQKAYTEFKKVYKKNGKELPKNNDIKSDKENDKLLRNLDCAVINYVHRSLRGKSQQYDTVRSPFIEGKEIYPGSSFKEKNHIQIAIRNTDCIKGVFLRRENKKFLSFVLENFKEQTLFQSLLQRIFRT